MKLVTLNKVDYVCPKGHDVRSSKNPYSKIQTEQPQCRECGLRIVLD